MSCGGCPQIGDEIDAFRRAWCFKSIRLLNFKKRNCISGADWLKIRATDVKIRKRLAMETIILCDTSVFSRWMSLKRFLYLSVAGEAIAIGRIPPKFEKKNYCFHKSDLLNTSTDRPSGMNEKGKIRNMSATTKTMIWKQNASWSRREGW